MNDERNERQENRENPPWSKIGESTSSPLFLSIAALSSRNDNFHTTGLPYRDAAQLSARAY